MATRRMFSKTITNSGRFIKMPATSRLLYYDLGMNADDDGYAEWFTVMRISGASEQDLNVLAVNGFVKIFDENVLIILDWKENNYIQKDRYTQSKYVGVYSVDTPCIQDVSNMDTQVRLELGKDSIDNKNTTTNVVEAKPLKIEKYGKEDINWVLQKFEEVFGMASQGNKKKDRFCAKHLLNNYTREQISYMMQFCAGAEYSPNVGSVEKLWYKRADIVAGIQKLKLKGQANQSKLVVI